MLGRIGRMSEEIRLGSAGVTLRTYRPEDRDAWLALRAGSALTLKRFEPRWPADELTRAGYRRRLRRYADELARGEGYAFLVLSPDGTLVGGCNLSNVRRGSQQTATLGYWMGEAFRNQGYMSAAVRLACRFAFTELGLHRIQAACLPDNEPSKAVLRKCGFREEGLARSFLQIDGVWRDHVVFALLAGDLPQAE